MLDTLLTLLVFLSLFLLAVAAILGLGRLLKQPDFGTGLAGMAVVTVGAPAILGGIVAGSWLSRSYPLAGLGTDGAVRRRWLRLCRRP